ncbi:hypothetical protein [Vitiosangium sp. GDMCC 1.1324]|uniref:hypothetical protein n=1 Tax=Vitiosangium sp. (strain GDMCC 1.1324) TaxID=2138576 RepID=UPI0011B7820D|nr:hypothetical protein [Vitiosangium sp. GDMCC 1.1324]
MDSSNFFAMGADEDVEPVWFDCYSCRNPEQLAKKQLGIRIMTMLALGAVGASTFALYRWRRRSRAMSSPPQGQS